MLLKNRHYWRNFFHIIPCFFQKLFSYFTKKGHSIFNKTNLLQLLPPKLLYALTSIYLHLQKQVLSANALQLKIKKMTLVLFCCLGILINATKHVKEHKICTYASEIVLIFHIAGFQDWNSD